MYFKRHRLLNDRKGMFGLYFSDFIALAVLFVMINIIFENTPLQILSFILPVISILIVIPIRKKYRKGVIRDFIKSKIRGKVIYDPRNI